MSSGVWSTWVDRTGATGASATSSASRSPRRVAHVRSLGQLAVCRRPRVPGPSAGRDPHRRLLRADAWGRGVARDPISVEHGHGREVFIPNIGRLRSPSGSLLTTGTDEYRQRDIADYDYHQLVSGVALNTYRDEQVPVGESRRGWLVFDVPASVSPGDATLSWQYPRDDHTSRATWELA